MSWSNVAASVRQRLLNRAREEGEDFQRLLVRYALERLLHRMTLSDWDDQFVLKGAFTFLLWEGTLHRPTRDLDLMGYGPPEPRAVEDVFRAIVKIDEGPDDGLRVKLMADLGSARIPLQIDVGFGDAITPDPESATFPALLEFPAPQIRIYPRESVVAEKLHGMVLFGIATSRMKDFYDIRYLAQRFAFEGPALTAAITATFERRETPLPEEVPQALTSTFADDAGKQQQWTAFLRRTGLAEKTLELPAVINTLRGFLLPPLDACARELAFEHAWQPGGPWKAE